MLIFFAGEFYRPAIHECGRLEDMGLFCVLSLFAVQEQKLHSGQRGDIALGIARCKGSL